MKARCDRGPKNIIQKNCLVVFLCATDFSVQFQHSTNCAKYVLTLGANNTLTFVNKLIIGTKRVLSNFVNIKYLKRYCATSNKDGTLLYYLKYDQRW